MGFAPFGAVGENPLFSLFWTSELLRADLQTESAVGLESVRQSSGSVSFGYRKEGRRLANSTVFDILFAQVGPQS